MTLGSTASRSIGLCRTFPARRGIRRGRRSTHSNSALQAFVRSAVPADLGHAGLVFSSACLERLLQIFPAAEVHRLADASHYVVEDAYEQIIPRMDRFLASLLADERPRYGATPSHNSLSAS